MQCPCKKTELYSDCCQKIHQNIHLAKKATSKKTSVKKTATKDTTVKKATKKVTPKK